MNITVRPLAMLAAVLLAACARISAPGMDFAGPTPSVDVKATQVDAPFSHFTGGLAASVRVQHAGPVPPTASALPAGPTTGTATYRLGAEPAFTVGDVVTVIWSAQAQTLLGAPHTVTQRAQYRIVAASLQVQAPAAGLRPGQSGTVCVALLPNAPAGAHVTLRSSAVSVAPTVLQVPAGQAKATAAATATMGGFSCPVKSGGARSDPAPCGAGNGVVASATFGGVTVQGCTRIAQTCCGVTETCASGPAPPSICP